METSHSCLSTYGLRGLPPELVCSSNAAAGFAGCTATVWLALSAALHPLCHTEGNSGLFVQTLKLLRDNQERWHAAIHACRKQLVLARNRLAPLSRAGELVAECGHQLAVAYYDDLERALWSASIEASLEEPGGGQASPALLGANLPTIAKVIAGGRPDDKIVAAPRRKTPRVLKGIAALETKMASLRARRHLGEEINVLIVSEVLEAARGADPAAGTARTTRTTRTTAVADKKQEARNKWIYKQCCKGKTMPYDKIIAELKKIAPKRGWRIVSTKQRIQQIGQEYAEAHNLPAPPPRQDPSSA